MIEVVQKIDFKDIMTSMWATLDKNQKVYVVIEDGDHVFTENPKNVDQMTHALKRGQAESEILFFNTKNGAEEFRSFLIESDELTPSTLTVQSIELSKAFEAIEIMDDYACRLYKGAPIRIMLVHWLGEEPFLDLLYSSLVTKH